MFGGTGEFELTTDDALSGDYNHDLTGSSYAISYNKTNKDKLYFGGGYQSVGVWSEEWQRGSSYNSGYWTYYSSSIGYFDAQVAVDEFRTNFLYGFIGYEIDLNENLLFQPNAKIGQKNYTAKWREYVNTNSYGSTTTSFNETASGFGLEIDLPFIFSFGEVFSLGVNICLCTNKAVFSSGSYKYTFVSTKALNLLLDWRI